MNTRWLTPFALAILAAGAHAQLISEIRIDQPGADNDEYFELAGTPGASLDGLTYVVIGDGSAAQGSGVVETVVSLDGHTIPASGFFVVAEATFTLGTADFTPAGSNPLNFENTDNVTHMLVSGFTGANGDDLDTNDDGVLDVLPWTSVLDSVAVLHTATGGDLVYSTTTVGPDGAFAPGHVYRCELDFLIGAFDPIGGQDTPGAANPCASEPLTFCSDEDGATASCPCGNVGTAGRGCDNAGSTGGVGLSTAKFDPDGLGGGSAVIVAAGFPPASFPSVVLMRSASQQAPAVFGDGLLCLQGPVVRVGSSTAVGGSAGFTLNHGAGAGDFHYQAWYRSSPAAFCDPLAAFNLSSGVSLTW